MSRLYGRTWKLTITLQSGEQVEITEGLQISFRCERRITETTQFAQVTIYNLSRNTENNIINNYQKMTLEAGYKDGPYGIIFAGPVYFVQRGKEDAASFFTKIFAIDGDDSLNLGFCNFNTGSGFNARQLAQQVGRRSSVPVQVQAPDDLNNQRLHRGRVYFGKPGRFLRHLAQSNNSNLSVQYGTAVIDPLVKKPTSFVELNSRTGMLGIPQQQDGQIALRCLINPNITLGTFIKLNNEDIIPEAPQFGVPGYLLDADGQYCVGEIVAMGDTRANDWEFQMLAFYQNGNYPLILGDKAQGF